MSRSPSRGPWRDAWHRLRGDGAAMGSSVFLLVLLAASVAGTVEHPRTDFRGQDLSARLHPPGGAHWMGTDALGRDIAARVLAGARLSLAIGLVAAAVALTIGVLYGAVAGTSGRWVEEGMMRLVDLLDSLPYMFVVIFLVSVLGRSLPLLFLALGATQWLMPARIVRAQVRTLRAADFVAASRALGGGTVHIFARHLLPNLLGVVVVYLTLTIPRVILFESFLSFLGLGAQPPNEVSWGMLMSDGLRMVNPIDSRWWVVLFPGAALAVTTLALNYLGDGLRDSLDPRTVSRR